MSEDCKNVSGDGQHSCRVCVDLLCDYLDGTLPPEDAAQLDAHLAACPPCVTFVNTYRSTTGHCRKALAEAIPEQLGAKLASFLREKIAKS